PLVNCELFHYATSIEESVCFILLTCDYHRAPRVFHSFPTRRSSDLFALSSNTPIISRNIQFFYMLFYLCSMLCCLDITLNQPLYLVLHGFLGIFIEMHSHNIHCATYLLPECYRCV